MLLQQKALNVKVDLFHIDATGKLIGGNDVVGKSGVRAVFRVVAVYAPEDLYERLSFCFRLFPSD